MDQNPIDRKTFFKKSGKSIVDGVLNFISSYKPDWINSTKQPENKISKREIKYLTPPGSSDRSTFFSECIGCGSCVKSCPHNSIKLIDWEDKKVAIINPYSTPCYICKEIICSKSCPESVLTPINNQLDINLGFAASTFECLNQKSGELICDKCQQYCPFEDRCITFNHFNIPVIDKKICLGCGICSTICPESPNGIIIFPKD